MFAHDDVTPRKAFTTLAVLAGLVLAAAGSGDAVFGRNYAAAANLPANVNAAVNAAAAELLNANSPVRQAAANAETVAKSSGLRDAIGGVWKIAWQQSWPFLSSLVTKFFALVGRAFASLAGAVRTGPGAPANANGAVNAAVNASP